MMKFLKLWFPAILYSGIIFYASSTPNVKTPLPGLQFDKILHIAAYAPFGFLIARAIRGADRSITGKMVWMWAIGISLVHGALDEYHQSFVPGRSTQMVDLIGDVIGGTLGGYIYLKFKGKKIIKNLKNNAKNKTI